MTVQKTNKRKPDPSIARITSMLQRVRDSNVQELLTEPGLMAFMERHFDVIAISAMKAEYLRRDLKQLLERPLDLSYYSSLITYISLNGQPHNLHHHHLFLNELLAHFSKYGFSQPQ
jgi:hypothetical protein